MLNSAGLRWLNPDEGLLREHASELDLEHGHFFEGGIAVVLAGLAPYLSAPERLQRGLRLTRDLVHAGGVTTIADMLAGGTLGRRREWEAFKDVLDREDVPFRTYLVSPPHIWGRREGEGTVETLLALPERNTHRLRWLKAIKTLGDGAFISQLMCLCAPGYIDGHHGEWLTPPDELRGLVEPYWRSGFDVYHHVNGDEGVDVALHVLETLQTEYPRADYRFDLEHFGISREDQVRPLLAVGTAVTRLSQSGTIRGPEQRIGVEQALRAVTIDAAWSLRLEREIGSIAAGKQADFTVLEADPREVEPEAIKEIPVVATVFEGTVYAT